MTSWSSLITSDDRQIVDWAEGQPWARAMSACGQDAGWHAEGDVWTHTRMVCSQLFELDEWQTLPRARQIVLLFTALFHDSGKPETTAVDLDTGRTHSPNHAPAGMKIARRALQEIECSVETREEICRLVRFHGRPTFLLHRSEPEREVISLSWQLSNRLLHLFARADSKGRMTSDMTRHVADLDLWKLVAQEQGCYDTPYPFANDHARFLFYRNDLSYPQYEPHATSRCTIHMLSGLPGAGKDTAIRAQGLAELPVVSLDELRSELEIHPTDTQGKVVQAARNACRGYLRAGRDFVFNATNITRQARKPWIDMAASYEARVRILYLEPPLRDIVARNRSRPKPVPDSVVQRLCDKLDPPTLTECHELTIVTDGVTATEARNV